MNRDRAYGLAAALALGAFVGFAFAPLAGRREVARRLRAGAPRLARFANDIGAQLRDFANEASSVISDLASSSIESLRKRAALLRAPIAKLKQSLSSDPVLGQRAIWVDAYGDTILLHGVVEDDEEWHSADTLARLVSPDGSVRNLLQVRRSADA